MDSTRVYRRSKEFMGRKYGNDTIAHISPSGTIDLHPKATIEDLEHEKGHWSSGFLKDLSYSSSYKDYLKEEINAWLAADSVLGTIKTEFVWRVASNATDFRGATPWGIVTEVTNLLRGTKYSLNKREKKWLLMMLKSVEES